MRWVDEIIVNVDRGLRAVAGVNTGVRRQNPSHTQQRYDATSDHELTAFEKRHASALMRINHAGEIAAQALYHGQSLTARASHLRSDLQRAAEDEADHLYWCRTRLRELDGRTSVLDPAWYAGAFAIGTIAGLAGDRISLGFLAETERQVVAHLEGHLERLPKADASSRAIVAQMRDDEQHHADGAMRAGAALLPMPVRALMRAASKVMTTTAYWL